MKTFLVLCIALVTLAVGCSTTLSGQQPRAFQRVDSGSEQSDSLRLAPTAPPAPRQDATPPPPLQPPDDDDPLPVPSTLWDEQEDALLVY